MAYFNLTTSKQSNKTKEIIYRKLKNINIANFSKDVESHLSTIHTDSLQLAGKIRPYRGTLEEILDKYVPLRIKRVPDKVKIPWFSDEVAAAIHDRRKAEWRWNAQRSDTLRFLKSSTDYGDWLVTCWMMPRESIIALNFKITPIILR